MKKRLSLLICALTAVLLLTVFASAEALVPSSTGTYTAGLPGVYPRFATMTDGSLIFMGGSAVYRSTNNGKTWTSQSINGLPGTVTFEGTTHTLSRENWQPFGMPDGSLLIAYRCLTKGYSNGSGEVFYCSIRVTRATFTGDAFVFEAEQTLLEDSYTAYRGFWEPYMIQIDENTVALYFADDHPDHVTKPSSQQNISYFLYDLTTGEWDTTLRVAIDGVARNSRDGMPAVTKLSDGTFAMVTESQDYASWNAARNGHSYNCTFVVGLTLSEDGRTWGDTMLVAGPEDLTSNLVYAAPFVATLPDGRIVISCQTQELYSGEIKNNSTTYNKTIVLIVSDDVVTKDSVYANTTGGLTEGFTRLYATTNTAENGYSIWNSVIAHGAFLYVAGGTGVNTSETTRRPTDPSVTILRLEQFTILDALQTLRSILSGETDYRFDYNGDGKCGLLDVMQMLKRIAQ